MKKIKVLLFVAVASIFAACDDAIDIKQPSELLPEDAFETVNDLRLGLNGVYAVIPGEGQIVFTSIFTDEVKRGIANGGQGVTDGGLSFVLDANSGSPESLWLANYRLINYATRLIEGAKNVTPVIDEEDGIDETEQYEDIIAQARALRAYGHFQLLSFFSENLKDDSALGVIALDYVPTKDDKPVRNTNGEVFALINSDLDATEGKLSLTTARNRTSQRDYVSVDFIIALRARMAAYRGQYTQAETFADDLITKYGLTKKYAGSNTTINYGSASDLIAKSSYVKMFRDVSAAHSAAQPNEVIFKAGRAATPGDPTGNFYQAWSSVNTSTTGSAFFEVSNALYTKLHPDDIRRAVIIDPSAFPGFGVRPVGKYAESESVPFLADVKIFRTSEMVLIKAEARASAGDLGGVATAINSIREARFGNANNNIGVPGNITDAWAAILAERRLELAFEGHRYLDIKRLGVLANASVDRSNADCSFNNACFIENTDHRWTMPIPRSERAGNPNVQQNTGY